jgi:hypothetical protein
MEAVQLHSLQMNNILFYIVFSRHCEFTSFLVKEMVKNIAEYYHEYKNTVECLHTLTALLNSKKVPHNHIVVLFFFFLSIDSKMRHWLLCTQQTQKDKDFRDKMLQKNIELVLDGTNSLSCNVKNPFLGQNVVFCALQPHAAVSILISISNENFFYPIFTNQDIESIDSVYREIKKLVVVS